MTDEYIQFKNAYELHDFEMIHYVRGLGSSVWQCLRCNQAYYDGSHDASDLDPCISDEEYAIKRLLE